MNYWLMLFAITPITLGIGTLIWYHRISKRIGNELQRRGIIYKFGALDFWYVEFASFISNMLAKIVESYVGNSVVIVIIGTLITAYFALRYIYKLSESMNLLRENYNHGI